MAKGKTTAFFCQNCGYESAKWMGQCPACKEWNTFVEEPVVKNSRNKDVCRCRKYETDAASGAIAARRYQAAGKSSDFHRDGRAGPGPGRRYCHRLSGAGRR